MKIGDKVRLNFSGPAIFGIADGIEFGARYLMYEATDVGVGTIIEEDTIFSEWIADFPGFGTFEGPADDFVIEEEA